ncbi:YfbM family protein [Aliinostoc sp. HNIBRCY26]|uniref:YfbM family protein n=1 Tax=Aliinostoc sp. HNIBRCY26 TaxID=3418997 RepID=UPI003CFD4CFE
MGMYGNFKAVTQEELDTFLTCFTTEEISTLLSVDGELDTSGDYLEIEKKWDGLHFLLTGSHFGRTPPLSWCVFGNHSIGGDEEPIFFGWIGIRYLLPHEVFQVAQALSETSYEVLASRYSPRDMDQQEVYPIGIWERDGDIGLDYILSCYPAVVSFYQKAARQNKAVLMYITS